MGGVVIIKRKGRWKVETWVTGEAPEHEHFSWDLWLEKGKKEIYPDLATFENGTGLLIGHRSDMFKGLLPYYLLDGITLTEGG